MSHTRYIITSSAWSIVNKVILFGITFATTIFLARYASKETIGQYAYILSITSIAGIATLPGTGQPLVRSIVRGFEGTVSTIARARFNYGIIGSLGIFCVAGYYAFFGNYFLGTIFTVIAFLIPFIDTFYEIILSFWLGRKRFDAQTFYSIAYRVLIALIIIPTIFFIRTPSLVILSFFIAPAVIGTILYYIMKQSIDESKNTVDPDALPFGKYLTFLQALSTIDGYLDKIILWQFVSPATLAIYTLAQLPASKIEQLIPITAVALPILSEGELTNGRKKRLLNRLFLLFIGSLLTASILYIIAPFIYTILFPGYEASVPLFRVLTFFVVALAPIALLKTAFTGALKKRELTIVQVSSSVVKIILLIILIPLFNIWGAIVAIIAGRIIEAIVSFILFVRL